MHICMHQVTAVDSDGAGLNSEVSYTLSPTASFFIINPVTGEPGMFLPVMSQAIGAYNTMCLHLTQVTSPPQ